MWERVLCSEIPGARGGEMEGKQRRRGGEEKDVIHSAYKGMEATSSRKERQWSGHGSHEKHAQHAAVLTLGGDKLTAAQGSRWSEALKCLSFMLWLPTQRES